MARTVSVVSSMVVFVLAVAGPARAGSPPCETTLLKESAALQRLVLSRLARCRSDVLLGHLLPLTDCTTHDPTGAVAAAKARFQSRVQAACDDAALASLAYPGPCPDLGGPPFTASDAVACIVGLTDDAAETIVMRGAPASIPLDAADTECERALLAASAKHARRHTTLLTKCLLSGGGRACGSRLNPTATEERYFTRVNKKCVGVKDLDFVDVLGYGAVCSGEGGMRGVASCLASDARCLVESVLPATHPRARAALDGAGRSGEFVCAGVSAAQIAFPLTMRVDVDFLAPACSETLEFSGMALLEVGSQLASSVETEIVALALSGTSACLAGPVTLGVAPSPPSAGTIDGIVGGIGGLEQGNANLSLHAALDTPLGPLGNLVPMAFTGAVTSLPPSPGTSIVFGGPPAPLVDDTSTVRGTITAAEATAEASPDCCDLKSFTKSGDEYDDSDGSSHKKIKFTFMVNDGKDPRRCILVNWLQGSFRKGDGTFFPVRSYDMTVDTNFPTKSVDSKDTDPAYWSRGGARWRYVAENATTASATDDPGPALRSEHGAIYAMKFEMCVYCIDDVPATAPQSGAGIGTAKACLPWEYSVVVGADGSFTHPALP